QAGAMQRIVTATSGSLRLVLRAVFVLLVAAVAFEGVRAYQVDLDKASTVSPYLMVGREIDSELASGAKVLGPERWSWALHQHPYVSLRNRWFQWVARANATGQVPNFSDWVAREHPESVVVNVNVRDDVKDFPETLQKQFWDFIERCTVRIGDVDDPDAYFD